MKGGTPGGASAGASKGGKVTGTALPPQVSADGSKQLPLQPGFEAVKGGSGKEGTSSSESEGAGGKGQTGTASATGSAAGKGQSYVPPSGTNVAADDRALLLGYFGASSRVTSAGW